MAGKNIKFILIVLFGISLVSCASKNPELIKQASMRYDIGTALLNKGDYPGSIQQLSEAKRLNPDDPFTYNALGLAYYAEGMKVEAEEAYKKALSLNKNFSDAYNNLGVLYLSEAQWDKAITAFHEALSNPLYMSPQIAWVNLGWAFYQKGKLDESLKAYKSALTILPDMPAAHNNMGLVYLRKNMLPYAEHEFKTAIYYFQGYAEAYLNLGIVYMKEKNDAEAKKQFETVLKLAPDSTFAGSAENYIKLLK